MEMAMPERGLQNLSGHISMLKETIFKTNLYPHFNLLLDDLLELSEKPHMKVLSLERTLLYGGNSLIAPIFESKGHVYISVDCTPEDRGTYNPPDERLIERKFDCSLNEFSMGNTKYDLIIVPNLVHHFRDQDRLFRMLRLGKTAYVFEPLVRELHQEPHDYLRYTPYGLRARFEDVGFSKFKEKRTGGPHEVVTYVAQQCEDFNKHEMKITEKDVEHAVQLDKDFPVSAKSHSSFPMAFSCLASR